ncbi:MAG: LPS assembly lipoprotein LptE [Proteobacteria bacterium]|nr:LPS assembly lipoprotein LptE [Pseudomonadota bacterium]
MRPARRSGFALVCAAAAILAVSACGFRPLYGIGGGGEPNPDVVAELGAIEIELGPDRLDQVVYSDLLDRISPFGPPSAPRYRLDLTLRQSKQGVALERDATVTRFNLTLVAAYVLADVASGETLTAGSVRAVAAYNVLRSELANVVAERDARDRAARNVADEINARLAVYFRGRTGP